MCLVVVAQASLRRVHLTATLSGLSLETRVGRIDGSGSFKQRRKDFSHRATSEFTGATFVETVDLSLAEASMQKAKYGSNFAQQNLKG